MNRASNSVWKGFDRATLVAFARQRGWREVDDKCSDELIATCIRMLDPHEFAILGTEARVLHLEILRHNGETSLSELNNTVAQLSNKLTTAEEKHKTYGTQIDFIKWLFGFIALIVTLASAYGIINVTSAQNSLQAAKEELRKESASAKDKLDAAKSELDIVTKDSQLAKSNVDRLHSELAGVVEMNLKYILQRSIEDSQQCLDEFSFGAPDPELLRRINANQRIISDARTLSNQIKKSEEELVLTCIQEINRAILPFEHIESQQRAFILSDAETNWKRILDSDLPKISTKVERRDLKAIVDETLPAYIWNVRAIIALLRYQKSVEDGMPDDKRRAFADIAIENAIRLNERFSRPYSNRAINRKYGLARRLQEERHRWTTVEQWTSFYRDVAIEGVAALKDLNTAIEHAHNERVRIVAYNNKADWHLFKGLVLRHIHEMTPSARVLDEVELKDEARRIYDAGIRDVRVVRGLAGREPTVLVTEAELECFLLLFDPGDTNMDRRRREFGKILALLKAASDLGFREFERTGRTQFEINVRQKKEWFFVLEEYVKNLDPKVDYISELCDAIYK